LPARQGPARRAAADARALHVRLYGRSRRAARPAGARAQLPAETVHSRRACPPGAGRAGREVTPLAGTYQLGLVALSVVIATMAAGAALDLAGRVTATRGPT